MRKSHGPMAVALLLAVACAPTTEVVNSWEDPSAGSVRFTKVLAVCACKDPGTRRTVEDGLAKRIKNSTQSYTILTDDDLHDREAAKAKVKAGGYDGAVVMALVNVDRTTTYVPGQAYAVPSYYNTMWGGWGYGWSTYYDPGYVQEDQYVDFNTNVYQVGPGEADLGQPEPDGQSVEHGQPGGRDHHRDRGRNEEAEGNRELDRDTHPGGTMRWMTLLLPAAAGAFLVTASCSRNKEPEEATLSPAQRGGASCGHHQHGRGRRGGR